MYYIKAFPVASFFTFFMFAFINSISQSLVPDKEIVAKVEEYMNAAVRYKNFSGSILVGHSGKPLKSKGYGMANYEWNIPNTPKTIFRLGSITKSITALAIMRLQDAGKLNINDPICKYLNDCPTSWQPITIYHLLTHTSGIPDYFKLPDYQKTIALRVTHTSMLERFINKPLEFIPGEKGSYSNSGFYLLGMIIEKVSGKSYAGFLQEAIFDPLGMKNTGYDSTRGIIPNRAAGYSMQGSILQNATYIDMSIPYAAGALYSTTEDLFILDQALYTEKLLSGKSKLEMFTSFKNERGAGWTIGKMFDRETIAKDGGIQGFSAYLLRIPSDTITIIVLVNNEVNAAQTIARDLAAIIYRGSYKIPQERKTIKVNSAILDKYTGQYQMESNFVITVTNENGRLMRDVNGQPKAELFAETETEFYRNDAEVRFTFVKDAEGNVTGVIQHLPGRNIKGQKIN